MNKFAKLFSQLEMNSDTEKQVVALAKYFKVASDKDKIWCLALLMGKRPKRLLTANNLNDIAKQISEQPSWLYETSQQIVGDVSETIALILPPPIKKSDLKLWEWIDLITSWREVHDQDRDKAIAKAWESLNADERFIFNKLVSGGFRLELAQKTLSKALSLATDKDEKLIARRLTDEWFPETTTFEELILKEIADEAIAKPYPFHLACTLDTPIEEIGTLADWQVERKWDGIRAQIIIRNDQIFVWSRKEVLLTHKIPEFLPLAESLPNGIVLDGEIICFKDGKAMPSNVLQTRFARKTISKKNLKEAPCVFMAYDLLEFEGEDIRKNKLVERRAKLENVILQYYDEQKLILLSDIIEKENWTALDTEREKSRAHQTGGLVLKKKQSPYGTQREKGVWWKWDVEPLHINAVLLYAQAGEFGSSRLLKEYTFAVWQGEDLVTFAKADSGLSDDECKEITAFVKKNTKERFGPVRSVTAELVFKISFQSIIASKRHKSGVVLKGVKIVEWMREVGVEEAGSLEDLVGFLEGEGKL